MQSGNRETAPQTKNAGSSGAKPPGLPWQLLYECEEAVIVVDASFRVAYVSERITEFSPVPPAQLLGKSGDDVFSVFTGSVFEKEMRLALQTRTKRVIVGTCPLTGRSLSARYAPVESDSFALFFRYLNTEPVVENAEAAPDVVAAYRDLLHLASDWVFELDTELRYTYVSPSATDILGYEPHEIIGSSPFDLVTPEYAESVGPMFRSIAATQTSFDGLECAYRTKTGEIVYQESSGTPTYNAAGDWTGYRGVKRNITAQKRREGVLKEIARKQSHIAETLQKSLLQTPSRVALPDIEVVTRYQAASGDTLIGGDLFDVYPLHENKVALVVGDIAGKGLVAATDMAEIKFLLRSYLRESSNPEAALVRLNRQLFLRQSLQGDSTMMVSLTVAVLDTLTGTARFAVAGMEPPLVIRPGTATPEPVLELITVGGLPLGALPSWRMDEGEAAVSLAPGDLLLLYTDGVVEARSKDFGNLSDPVFGAARLVRAVRTAAGKTLSPTAPRPVAVICDAVLAAVEQFTGDERRDDICLLLAKYAPQSPPVPEPPLAVPDTANTLMSRVDADWRYTFVDENIEEATGQLQSEVVGKTVWEAFPAFVDTDFDRMVRRARAENITLVADMELVPPGVLYRVAAIPLPFGELEIRTLCLPTERTSDLSRALEVALREREIALRDREAALRGRETALREIEQSRDFQRRFLTEVLANVTGGRLRLCSTANELPPLLPALGEPIVLQSSAHLSPFRRTIEAVSGVVGLPPARAYEFMMSAGEAAMNCVVHGGGGVATLHGDPETGQMQVCITDTGTGIAEETLHRATLERGYTTAGSLGLGFSLIYSAADRVFLLTGATGTTLILEQHRDSAGARELLF